MSKTSERIIKLEPITQKDFKEISKLTSDIEVMKYVGNGKVWTSHKVSKFIQYCVEEEKLDDSKRTQYYYKIVEYQPISSSQKSKSKSKSNSRGKKRLKSLKKETSKRKSSKKNKMKKYFVGLIGFHKFIRGDEAYLTEAQKQRKDEYYLTVFKKRKFNGTTQLPRAMEILIKKMKKHVPEKDSLYLWVREDNMRMNFYSQKHYKFIGKVHMRPGLVLNEYQLKFQ